MEDQLSLNRSIASEIRAMLARREITQGAFARQCGWSIAFFSRRMNGEVPFNTDEIERIAKELDIPLDQLTNPVQR